MTRRPTRRAVIAAGLAALLPSCTSQRPEEKPMNAGRRLLAAVDRDAPDEVRAAINAGADLEIRDGRRRTPLLIAATRDHVKVAGVLMEAGADVNAVDAQRDTPFLVTGVTGSVAMLKVLLPGRPDFTIYNRYGGTALIPACERGHVNYVREIVKTDVDIDHVNNLGWTGLLEAVILGDGGRDHQQVVRILLDAGAAPDRADADGVTPLAHARSRGYTEIADILVAAGAA